MEESFNQDPTNINIDGRNDPLQCGNSLTFEKKDTKSKLWVYVKLGGHC